MTLFRVLQILLERTYAAEVGLNLEECLVDGRQCRWLTERAGEEARFLSGLGRTFLRPAAGRLRIAIHYAESLIRRLEECDPRAELSARNLTAFLVFAEEINHAVHAALLFRGWTEAGAAGPDPLEGEAALRNLELLAQVDAYLLLLFFVARFRDRETVEAEDREWAKFHLFEEDDGRDEFYPERLRERYAETRTLARNYTNYLDTLPGTERLGEIRGFRPLDYSGKQARIAQRSFAEEARGLAAISSGVGRSTGSATAE